MNGKRVKRLRRLLRQNMAPGHPGFESAFKAVKRAAARGLPQPKPKAVRERKHKPAAPLRDENGTLHCQLVGRTPFSLQRRIWRDGEPVHVLRPNRGKAVRNNAPTSMGVPN